MTALHVELLGWAATTVFVASYFCGRARALVGTQIAGALLWTAYGVLVRSPPVVAANVLVVGAAVWKMRRSPPPRAPAPDVARSA